MITIDPRPGESLSAYLARVIATAQRTRTDMLVGWQDRTAIVTGRSTMEAERKELATPPRSGS
jgi:hypothetical protein